MAIIDAPATTDAFRLTQPSYHQKSIEDYKMASGPITVDTNTSQELANVLLDDSTYLWDLGKGCEPDYGVRVRFVQSDDTVDVLFCFACDILSVYFNGDLVGGEDFDDARLKMVAIMKELFPQDDVIQSLK